MCYGNFSQTISEQKHPTLVTLVRIACFAHGWHGEIYSQALFISFYLFKADLCDTRVQCFTQWRGILLGMRYKFGTEKHAWKKQHLTSRRCLFIGVALSQFFNRSLPSCVSVREKDLSADPWACDDQNALYLIHNPPCILVIPVSPCHPQAAIGVSSQ